ncbi:MAG: hypothetical protein JRH11_26045 [Deltaproteobacteria bacterium]|nr:hypothetical protein [Deltaproteobacteria bacterium]
MTSTGITNGAWLVLALTVCVAAPAQGVAQAQQNIEVVDVITATGDVRDIATSGDRTLLATSGGLVIRRAGEVEGVFGARHGLPGERLRSVSVLGDEVVVGGVEGTVVMRLDERGAPTAVRPIELRRVRRAARFGGAIWAGTYGNGLYRIEGDDAPTRIDLGPQGARSRITDILVRGDELWVATAGSGILRVDAEGRTRGRIRQGLAELMVWDLEPAGSRVLAATLSGVSVIGEGNRVENRARIAQSSRFLPIRDTRALHFDRTGRLFIATFGAGVFRLDADARRPVQLRHRATDLRTHAIAGAEDTVLIGHGGGLDRLDGDRRLTAVSTGGLPSADVTAVARAFGAMWIGTFDGGLARYRNGRVEAMDRAATRFHVDSRINDLAVTGRGRTERLWIATDRGLFFHDGRRFIPVEDRAAPGRVHVTSLDVDPNGALWVTSSRMLSRFRGGRWQSWSGDPTFPVVHLHAVTTDRQGHVWVGSLHGLYRFDPRAGTFERHTTASGALPVDWVTAVEPWNDGVVIGTYHGGLSWSDGRSFDVERVTRGSRAGSLPAGWVNPHAMRWVEGQLFVGTLERGLLVGRRGAWTHLTVADGLPSADVTDVIPDGRGAAWVATTVADGLPSADVTDVIPDGRGAAWVATRCGLARVRWDR